MARPIGGTLASPALRKLLRIRGLSRRAREVGPRTLGLLFKTFWLLLASRLALRWIPVHKVIAWKQRPLSRRAPLAGAREQCQRVRYAVLVTAHYSPVLFVCFPRCLAASELLRAQGIDSRLHYGVAREGEKLVTHTWLEAEGEVLIGGEVADQYSTLAVY